MRNANQHLEAYFHRVVQNSYEHRLGLKDPEVMSYVARLLCEFSETDNLFRVRDEMGNPLQELEEMKRASDPVFGTAPSFDRERAVRKFIGDFGLFVAGMCPEILSHVRDGSQKHPYQGLDALIQAGKESYAIVSQFNLFEYENEAPLFARLSASYERCILGLTMVREEIGPPNPLHPPSPGVH